jgi:hypothetical protein
VLASSGPLQRFILDSEALTQGEMSMADLAEALE